MPITIRWYLLKKVCEVLNENRILICLPDQLKNMHVQLSKAVANLLE